MRELWQPCLQVVVKVVNIILLLVTLISVLVEKWNSKAQTNKSIPYRTSSLDKSPDWHRPINFTSITKTLPLIFFITPTYTRVTQKADLTRLCQTLKLVPNILWILVEDSPVYTPVATSILNHCGTPSVHLSIATATHREGGVGHRGVEQRNVALQWIREHYKEGDVEGVVYFGDDDNAYDIRLFEEV